MKKSVLFYLSFILCCYQPLALEPLLGTVPSGQQHSSAVLLIPEKQVLDVLKELENKHVESDPGQLIPASLELREEERGGMSFSFRARSGQGHRLEDLSFPLSWILEPDSAKRLRFCRQKSAFCLREDQAFPLEIQGRFKLKNKTAFALPSGFSIYVELGKLSSPIALNFPHTSVELSVKEGDSVGCGNASSLVIKRVDPPEPKPVRIEEAAPDLHAAEPLILGIPRIEMDLGPQESTVWIELSFRVLHGAIHEMPLTLPKGIELDRISFKPATVFHLSQSKLFIPAGLHGNVTLNLKVRQGFSRSGGGEQEDSTKISRSLLLPSFPSVKILPGTLLIFSTQNLKIEKVQSRILEPFHGSLPAMRHGVDLPVLKAFSLQGLGSEIQAELKQIPASSLQSLQVLHSSIESVLTGNGAIAHTLFLQMRNQGEQSFSIPLGKSMTLLGATLDDKPVKSFLNDAGEVMIQLGSKKKANPSDQVRLRLQLLETQDALRESLELSVPSPPRSLRTDWKIYHPATLRVEQVETNLQAVSSSKAKVPAQTSLAALQRIRNRFLNSIESGLVPSITAGIGLLIALFALVLLPKIIDWVPRSSSGMTGKKMFFIIGGVGLVLGALILISIPSFRQARQRSTLSHVYESKSMPPAPSSQLRLDAVAGFGGGRGSANGAMDEDMSFEDDLFEPEEEGRKDKKESRSNKAQRKKVRRYSRRPLKQAAQAAPSKIAGKSKLYSKVRRSGVKPVEVRIPKLDSTIRLSSRAPLASTPRVSLVISKEKQSSTLPWLGVILGLASLGLLSKGKYIFAATGLSIFLWTWTLSPSLMILGVFLALSLLFWLSRFYSGSFLGLGIFGLIFITPGIEASSYLAEALHNASAKMHQQFQVKKRIQQQESQGRARILQAEITPPIQRKQKIVPKPPVPEFLQVYEVYEPQNRQRLYQDKWLVNQAQWNTVKSLSSQKPLEKEPGFLSQEIQVVPQPKRLNLQVIYRLTVSPASQGEGMPLFTSAKDFQVEEIRSGERLLAVSSQESRGQILWRLEELPTQVVEIRANVPLRPHRFHESYNAFLPVVESADNQVSMAQGALRLELDSGVFEADGYRFSAKDGHLNLQFLRSDQIKQPVTSYRKTRKVLPTFQSKKSSMNCVSTLRWEKPYFFLNNQVRFFHTKEVWFPVPDGAQIVSLQVKNKARKELMQGIDYGFELLSGELKLSFEKVFNEISVQLEWMLPDSGPKLAIPISVEKMKRNHWTLKLLPREGQTMAAVESPSLSRFAINRFSAGSRESSYQNLQGEAKVLSLKIEKEERKVVRLSSTRCSHYDLKVFLLSPTQALQRMSLSMVNRGAQFLEVEIPKNTTLEFARINDEALVPVVKDPQTLLIPLKKYRDETTTFQVSLDFRVEINSIGEFFHFLAPVPKTDVNQFFVSISSNRANLEFDEGALSLRRGVGSNQSLPRYPRGRGKTKAINFPFPQGTYRWGAPRYGLPEELHFKYRQKEDVQVEMEEQTPIPWRAMALLIILGAGLQISRSYKTFLFALLFLTPLTLVFGNPIFSYFALILTMFWLSSEVLTPLWRRLIQFFSNG
jgi:hypothetical protein